MTIDHALIAIVLGLAGLAIIVIGRRGYDANHISQIRTNSRSGRARTYRAQWRTLLGQDFDLLDERGESLATANWSADLTIRVGDNHFATKRVLAKAAKHWMGMTIGPEYRLSLVSDAGETITEDKGTSSSPAFEYDGQLFRLWTAARWFRPITLFGDHDSRVLGSVRQGRPTIVMLPSELPPEIVVFIVALESQMLQTA